MKPHRILLAGSLALLTAGLTGPAIADDVIQLGRRLAQLRGEVEGLSGELARQEAERRDRMVSLARQKADLEAELKRDQMRLQRITHETQQKAAATAEQSEQSKKLVPIFDASVGALRRHIRTALPFRAPERLGEIDRIVEQHKSGLLTTQRALARLWSFVEDEIRLTKESGVYRQGLVIDGTEQLVDVVRVGMVMLFFKTGDDVVGHAVKVEGTWTTRAVTATDDRKRVLALFDNFKKRIRVGYFEIPNALSEAAK